MVEQKRKEPKSQDEALIRMTLALERIADSLEKLE
jgi:hypothetical protein